MRPEEVNDLLEKVTAGSVSVDEALRLLRRLPVEDLGFARIDTHRELRQGLPEAIYGEGKTTNQIAAIADKLFATSSSPVLVTRVSEGAAADLIERWPSARHYPLARLVVLGEERRPEASLGTITVVCAGTSDLPVAEEAAIVADAGGARVHRISDVGVAGLHRVMSVQDELHNADVVIVVAGMEGALASLVGGITGAPVVAVPTSVGYGASFEGLAALLAMLNSCAAGVTVTNIDNGFGAAAFALRVLRTRSR